MTASSATLEKLAKLSAEETFKVKSKAMALNLLDDCYEYVTSKDEPATFQQKMEMLKTAAKFGDLEPKEAKMPVGVGFSIKIVYSGGDSKASGTVTIDQDTSSLGTLPGYLSPSAATNQLAALPPPLEVEVIG